MSFEITPGTIYAAFFPFSAIFSNRSYTGERS